MQDEAESYERKLIISIVSLILLAGSLGNLLNVIILSRKSMRGGSTFRLLLNLSIIDMLVLLICTLDAMMSYGFNFQVRLVSSFVCRWHTFLTYYLSHMSSIVLMAVSVERLSIVCQEKLSISNWLDNLMSDNQKRLLRQLKIPTIKKFAKTNRVTMIMLTIGIVLMLINIHYLIFFKIEIVNASDHATAEYGPTELLMKKLELFEDLTAHLNNRSFLRNITINEDNDNMPEIEDVAFKEKIIEYKQSIAKLEAREKEMRPDVELISCFPHENTKYFEFLVNVWIWIDISIYSMIPFIIMLICTIVIYLEIRRKTCRFLRWSHNLNRILLQKKIRKNNQMFILLTATNGFFIFCTLPYCILSYVAINQNHDIEKKFLFIAHILSYSNNSFNFIFYGLFSEKYRQELKLLLNGKSEVTKQSKPSHRAKTSIRDYDQQCAARVSRKSLTFSNMSELNDLRTKLNTNITFLAKSRNNISHSMYDPNQESISSNMFHLNVAHQGFMCNSKETFI